MALEKQRILVVDDDPKITRLLRLNLELTGDYQVKEENRALHALTTAREFHPDLILLDVLMPGLDGGSVAEHFQRSADLKHVPIIFLTAAVTRDELRSRAGVVGGLPFLAKPVDLHEVVRCLQERLGRSVRKAPVPVASDQSGVD